MVTIKQPKAVFIDWTMSRDTKNALKDKLKREYQSPEAELFIVICGLTEAVGDNNFIVKKDLEDVLTRLDGKLSHYRRDGKVGNKEVRNLENAEVISLTEILNSLNIDEDIKNHLLYCDDLARRARDLDDDIAFEELRLLAMKSRQRLVTSDKTIFFKNYLGH